LGAGIRGAAKYLASSCDSDGKFSYLTRANGLPHDGQDTYDVTQVHKIPKVFDIVTSCRKYSRELTFENVEAARVGGLGSRPVRPV
jgi:hypothetical protein